MQHRSATACAQSLMVKPVEIEEGDAGAGEVAFASAARGVGDENAAIHETHGGIGAHASRIVRPYQTLSDP